MKKKTMTKQVVKALAVGLSALIALQPVAVVNAVDDEAIEVIAKEPVVTADVQPATSDDDYVEPTPTDIEGGIADKAQQRADVLSNDVETDEENGQVRGDLDTTIDDTDTLLQDVLVNENKPWEGAPTSAVPGEAGPGRPFGDAAVNVIGDAVIIAIQDHAEKAKEDVENAKTDLANAEIAEKYEEIAAQDASAIVKEEQTLADDTYEQVDAAVEQAKIYAADVMAATTKPAAQSSYDSLVKLANDTNQAVIDANEEMKKLNGKYDLAIEALTFAQDNFEQAINGEDGASADVAAASAELKRARAEVSKLEADIAVAENNIKEIHKTAFKIIALQEEIANETDLIEKSKKQDDLFITVIRDHVADIIGFPEAYLENVTKSDNGYFTLRYFDAFGYQEKHYTYEVNEDGSLSFRPKTEEQIAALDYVAEYQRHHRVALTDEEKDVFKVKKDFFGGSYDKLYTRYELDKLVEKGEVVVVDDTYWFLNGKGEKVYSLEVVNEKNANALYNKLDQGESKELVNGIVKNTAEESFEVVNGVLVKHTKATITTATYERAQTEEADYEKAYIKKGKLVKGYTEKEKEAAQKELEKEFKQNDEETLVVSKIVNEEQTYVVITGTYTPAVVLKLDGKNIYKVALDDDIPFLWLIDSAKGQVYDDVAWETFGSGYSIDPYNSKVTADYEGFGNFKMGGQVVLTYYRDFGTITSDEFIYANDGDFSAVISNLEEKIAKDLADYQKKHPCSGAFQLNDVVIDSYKTVWPWAYDVHVQPELSFEYSTDKDIYQKYSYYIDYIKKFGEETKENQEISTSVYLKARYATEILQSEGPRLALIDPWYQQYLNYAKDLLDKYERYAEEAEVVHQDIKQSQKDLRKLDRAINRLNDTQRAGKLLAALLDGERIADYFGISELPEDEKAEILGDYTEDDLEFFSVGQLISLLDLLKERANAKLLAANLKLEELNGILEEATNRYNSLPTPGPGPGPGPGEPGEPSGPVYGGPTAVVNAPVAEEPAEVLGEVRRVSRRRTAATVEEVEAPVVEETPAVQGEQREPEKVEEPVPETTIVDEDTAKAAAPVVAEKTNNWWWILIILAAIAGVSVEEIVRRRNAKAKANGGNDTLDKDI